MGQRSSLVMNTPLKFQGIWWEIARYGEDAIERENRLKYEFIYQDNGYAITVSPAGSACPNSIPYQGSANIIDNTLQVGSVTYLIYFTDYVNWAFLGTSNHDRLVILGRRDRISSNDRALIMAATDKLGFPSDKLLTFPEVLTNHGVNAPDSMTYVKL